MRTEGSGWNTPGLGIHTECVRPYRAPLMRLPFASPPWRPTRPQREGVRWSRCDPPPPLGLSSVLAVEVQAALGARHDGRATDRAHVHTAENIA
jgi:hypothetical protein